MSVSGLTASTTYTFTVLANDEAANSSAQSSELNVTTAAPVVNYCTSSGNNTSYEWIDLVQLGSINNSTSANGGYGDFTSLSTSLAPGSSNTITFSAGFRSSTYSENWKVWIDYNQDGDFNDSGEQVVSGNTSNASNYSATFTVPSGAALGATRMRVSMVWNATPSTCGTFSYGEVEDYTVVISNTAKSIEQESVHNGDALNKGMHKASLGIYPNPAAKTIHVSLAEFNEASSYRVLDIGGRVMFERSTSVEKISVDGLKPGIYLLEVETEKGTFKSKFLKN